LCEPDENPSKRLRILPNLPLTQVLLCARAALLCACTRCTKLPSDFIEKLPASIVHKQIARDAFKDTPLHGQCIARTHVRKEGYSVDAATGTIATFGEGVETIEMQDEEDKKKVVKVIVNNGAITIGKAAFAEYKVLAVVSVPGTLETMGNLAFHQ
jgi:hypothetical protein